MSSPSRGVILALAACSAAAWADVPPGYHVVQLTQNPYLEYNASINNCGQAVFAARLGAYEELNKEEIFLYDNGQLTQLTHDDVRDWLPVINDNGTIAWSRGIGPMGPYGFPTTEIVIYQDGELTRLTDDGYDDRLGGINSRGELVWHKWVSTGCQQSGSNIYFYDGVDVTAITADDWSNQAPELNDDGWIAWTRYNFCSHPWTSDILLYRDGEITQLTDHERSPQVVDLNNAGQVAWGAKDWATGQNVVRIWENGEVTTLTDWGMNPKVNDRGDVYFIRWYEQEQVYQAWLYLNGQFWQLSDDPFWNTDGDINNRGECIWRSGDLPYEYPSGDMRLLQWRQLRNHGPANRVSPRSMEPISRRP